MNNPIVQQVLDRAKPLFPEGTDLTVVGAGLTFVRISASGPDGLIVMEIPISEPRPSPSPLIDLNRAPRQKGTTPHPGPPPPRGRRWRWYRDYLNSREWEERRQRVFRRAQNRCEGCGDECPTQVHHRTYEHVGDEFLFELIALCPACHARLHRKR